MRNLKINIFILGIIIIIISFVNNDAFLYNTPIMKITDIQEEYADTQYSIYAEENYYLQSITGIVLNGKYKGMKVTTTNERSTSLIFDEKYSVGDKVFINITNIKNSTVEITEYKRDVYIVGITLFFVYCLFLIGKNQGLLSFLSLIINILIYCFTIYLYLDKNINLILLSCLSSIVFTIISLLISIGINKKSLVTILSTIGTVALTVIIGVLVMNLTNESGIRIEQIDFLLTPYKEIFISELLLGSLGAIMDIAITISSTVNELLEKRKDMSKKDLYASCREIGKDTMGTMLNVLLFTYICCEIPKFILFYRNGFSLKFLMTDYISIDVCRSLIAGIGIVLAIPITSFIAINILRGNRV